jgi:hypothetical protein
MLTGYAELESALEALNESGVEVYAEKPWQPQPFSGSILRLLATHLNHSDADRHLLWRELASESDIVRHMQLRFEVYARSAAGIQNLLPRNTNGLDVDEYDPVSRHYGLFAADITGIEMIGTHRHVPAPAGEPSAVVRDLCARRGLLGLVDRPREHVLPMLKYISNRVPILALVDAALARGERVFEPTRATVAEGPWHRIWGTKLLLHIAESAAAQAYYLRGDALTVMSCTRAHAVAYKRMLGWRDVPGIAPEDVRLRADAAVISSRPEDVPAPVRERCEALAARITRTGEACRCAAFPACLGGPYESGDFAGVDVLCPVRAKEILGPS